jgi:hypothetical protein
MLHETLGDAWMTNEWFRFGASSLANDILLQLGKEKTAHTKARITSRTIKIILSAGPSV